MRATTGDATRRLGWAITAATALAAATSSAVLAAVGEPFADAAPPGTFLAMLTTIDGAGRLVVPKALRDRLGLQGGDAVEVSEEAGAIVITRPHRELPLVESDGGILTASPEVGLPPTDPEQVRQWLERLRR